jgi:TrmH family RNA methyltransferase
MENSTNLTPGLIKLLSSLKNKKYRNENKLFIAEGEKLCDELYNSSFKTKIIILKKEHSQEAFEISKRFEKKKIPQYFINEKIFNKISDTKSPQDILAVVNFREDAPLHDEPFIALENLGDPGNIGTIIRTAEWFGFRQILLSESCADKYNPKLVRATMGSIFRVSIIDGLDFKISLKKYFPKHNLYGASITAKNGIHTINTKGNFGLIFGSESHGLSREIRKILTREYKIPGIGAESLNVSVAAGISMYHFKNFC